MQTSEPAKPPSPPVASPVYLAFRLPAAPRALAPLMPIDMVIPKSYDYRIVALSVFVSLLAAYAARDLTEQVGGARGRAWWRWLVGAAVVDGIGTWSMHYTGMLAFHSTIPVFYHWPTVVLSYMVGVAGSAAALAIISRGTRGWSRTVAASVCLGGVGISGLHFTAMMAMRQQAVHQYAISLGLLSVFLGIVISLGGLVVIDAPEQRSLQHYGGPVLRGAANPVMHYTAMASITFVATRQAPDLSQTVSIETLGILGLSIVPVMVLVVGLLTSFVGRLQRQRALLDHLFEQAPQAIALMDAQGRVIRVNQEFTRLFGYTPQEAVGRRIKELIVPEESRGEFEGRSESVAHGQRVEGEVLRQRKDGTRLYALAASVPVSIPDGQIAVYDARLDVTKRKEAEAALQTLSLRLLAVQEAERQHLARELHRRDRPVADRSSTAAEAEWRLACRSGQDPVRPGPRHCG